MARKIDNASLFRNGAIIAAVLLILSAALIYLQAGGGNSVAPELAALSQAVPTQAARALGGDSGAFEQLEISTKKLAALQRDGAAGRSSDWRRLESRAAAILEQRPAIEAVHSAANRIGIDAASLVKLADELLNRSGATATIQEFQQRADRIRETAAGLPAGGESAASAIAEDIGFLRNVANALNGATSDLDIRPLNRQGREVALVPVISSLSSLEEQSAILDSNIGAVVALAATVAELSASAEKSLGTAFGLGGGTSLLPSFLVNPWIPIGMVGFAALLIG